MTFSEFIQHPLVLFGAGILVAYLFHLRQKHHRRLSYQSLDTVVIDPKVNEHTNELEIRYAGDVVPQVTRTAVRFWNSGTETIDGDDVSSSDPFRWEIPDGAAFLATNVERVTRDPIQVKIDTAGNALNIRFEFLDAGDGAVVSVLHTGIANKSKMKGTIKGLHGKIENWGVAEDTVPRSPGSLEFNKKWRRRLYKFFIAGLTLMLIYALLTLLSGVFPNYFLENFPDFFTETGLPPSALRRDTINTYRIFEGIVGLLFFGLIAFVTFHFWRTKPPQKLKS